MSLKLGEWKINANGLEGKLIISTVQENGLVLGTINDMAFTGIWDEISRILTFSILAIGQNSAYFSRIYKGALFGTPPNTQIGQDVLWTLAGLVENADFSSVEGIAPIPRRREFGWFAQTTEIF